MESVVTVGGLLTAIGIVAGIFLAGWIAIKVLEVLASGFNR